VIANTPADASIRMMPSTLRLSRTYRKNLERALGSKL
jgi:hypothetical protein